jgi:hypothetical protein
VLKKFELKKGAIAVEQEDSTLIPVLDIKEFPAYKHPERGIKPISEITRYLQDLLTCKFHGDYKNIELPPFNLLLEFFNCSHLECYDSFSGIRFLGYNFEFLSLDKNIRVWREK